MTTGKRQIPINHHAPAGAHADDPAAGGGPAQPVSGQAASRAEAAGAPPKTAPGGPHGHHEGAASQAEMPVAELEALLAERDALAAERDALAAQVEAVTDSRLRLQAEFENFRRRASREAVESHVRAQCEVLNDFLPILDNLERALDAAEHHEEGKVLAGVRMTRDMFVALLTRTGVEEIGGVGAPFDPEVHDAMAVQPSEYEEGTIAAVLERGYRQGERILRPARVVVSAGRAGSSGESISS
jgi:molecular chaperone GrpE